jgi:hypothetical protein
LELLRDKQPRDVKLEAVARSSARSSLEHAGHVDMKLRDPWTMKPPSQQVILAAYAQGLLKSAFSSKRAPRSSRVLVLSSSQFLTNPFAYLGNPAGSASQGDAQLLMFAQPYTKYLTAMIISFKNSLDWMSAEDDLIAVSAKLIGPARHRRQHRAD